VSVVSVTASLTLSDAANLVGFITRRVSKTKLCGLAIQDASYCSRFAIHYSLFSVRYSLHKTTST